MFKTVIKNILHSHEKYYYSKTHCATVGLSKLTQRELTSAKRLLDATHLPWRHYTENLPDMGILIIGNFTEEDAPIKIQKHIESREEHLKVD